MEPKRKHVLIAVDGSEQAFEAVRYAGRVWPEGKARITLLSVIDPFPEFIWDLESGFDLRTQFAGIEGWEIRYKTTIRDFMDKARLFLTSRGVAKDDISVILRDRKVDIALDIALEAQQGGYDALMVGRHGVSRMKDLLFGSVSSKLVGGLKGIPLCVVGGSPEPGKILIAMDGSEGAGRALDFVGELFRESPTEFLLLYINRKVDLFEPELREVVAFGAGRDWLEQAHRALEASELRMESCLREGAKRLEDRGIEGKLVKSKIAHEAFSASQAIVQEALSGGYGTIVLGRRGLSRIEEFFIGRVSSEVLQLARDRAVWIVH